MDFTEVVNRRYSCRKFDGRAVERETLLEILEAGRQAPTAKNLQEQRIYIMESPEALAMIDTVTRCRYHAGTVAVVAFRKDQTFTYPGGKYNSGIEDAAIVATQLVLAAENAGVASCWVNLFDPDVLAEKMGLPENEEILTLLDFGYAAEDAVPGPMHPHRKELAETVSFR